MGDVTSEAAIGVCPSEVTSGLPQTKAIVCELLSEVSQLSSATSDLGTPSPIADHLGTEGVVVLLLQGPVDALRVSLSIGKEELLSSIE